MKIEKFHILLIKHLEEAGITKTELAQYNRAHKLRCENQAARE